MKRTVIVGASPNQSRYAYMATVKLKKFGHDIIPLGIRSGEIENTPITDLRQKPEFGKIHTLTVYLSPAHQDEWRDYLLSLKPKRIIFNPGAENPSFEAAARSENIEVVHGCTLVMLSTNEF
ncbi:MAG: CoA-binding protein [Cyclobacteriaceae bacterium]